MKLFRKIAYLNLFLISLAVAGQGVKEEDHFLRNLMKSRAAEFKFVIDHKKQLEVQIIYTQINRDEHNFPHFKTYYFNVDSNRYFYPASTVKLPLVLLAFEKLNQLNIPGLDRNTIMCHDSVYAGQQSVCVDTTSEGGMPTIANYSKKIFLVSDNDAFNRLYEFVGQKAINTKLTEKGYNLKILHRLARSTTPDQNRHTEAVRFLKRDSIIYYQPMLTNDSIVVGKKILKGKGYYSKNVLIRKPMDFSYQNFFSLTDQHEMLKALIFPQAVVQTKRFNLRQEDRKFILQCMSQLPRETLYPSYFKDTIYYDGYSKYFMVGGDTARIPSSLRIFNKVGGAYGYTIDNAYVVDFKQGIEFLLSAVIHSNKDGIFNDDKYEYLTVCFPFMKNIGKLIYNFECNRPRPVKPDLSEFRLTYDIKY